MRIDQALETAVFALLVGAALLFGYLSGSVAIVVAECEQQTLKRLFTSPLRGIPDFLGIFLAHSLIGLGQTLRIYYDRRFLASPISGFAAAGRRPSLTSGFCVFLPPQWSPPDGSHIDAC